jgi:hypothetical protein
MKLTKGIRAGEPNLEKALEILENSGYQVTAIEDGIDYHLQGLKVEPSTTVQDMVYSEAGFCIWTSNTDNRVMLSEVGMN